MSALKLSSVVSVVFVALAMLVASSQTARAETIFLTCNIGTNTKTFTVDLTNNTVNNLAAAIDATSIDWQSTEPQESGRPGDSNLEKNSIDRTSGTFKRIITIHFANGFVTDMGPITGTCTKGGAPATQF